MTLLGGLGVCQRTRERKKQVLKLSNTCAAWLL